ncbi:hypothetical protein HOL34_02985 [bacterium]|nr:hypothetical protein [bacterium]MBT3903441.1 hypothetical protein [bacterium]MBT4577504.1 hypothetical protein [bacterium]MBT5345780.1 hypothetical protein [bacterium]MBT6130879.1 hypothetical protein [bacterium]
MVTLRNSLVLLAVLVAGVASLDATKGNYGSPNKSRQSLATRNPNIKLSPSKKDNRFAIKIAQQIKHDKRANKNGSPAATSNGLNFKWKAPKNSKNTVSQNASPATPSKLVSSRKKTGCKKMINFENC